MRCCLGASRDGVRGDAKQEEEEIAKARLAQRAQQRSAAESADAPLRVNVCTFMGKTFTVTVGARGTVQAARVKAEKKAKVDEGECVLMLGQRPLANEGRALVDCGVHDHATLRLAKRSWLENGW